MRLLSSHLCLLRLSLLLIDPRSLCLYLPRRSSSEPRRPSTGPGSTSQSLSERIAALQRKASPTDLKNRPVSPSTNRSISDSYSSEITNNERNSPTSPRSTSSLHPSSAATSGGGGVRDRIARFQSNSTNDVLIPRSSFGAPAPNPEVSKNSIRKGFSGASGGGTGAWGEGVLLPQLTGGAWGGNTNQSLRPQLTGGAWAAAQSARDYNSSNSGNRWKPKDGLPSPGGVVGGIGDSNVPLASPTGSTIRGSGKDAFAELDEENSLSSREAQSLGGDSTSNGKDSAAAPSLDLANLNLNSTRESGLPNLPDAPKTEIHSSEAIKSTDSNLEQEDSRDSVSASVGAWKRLRWERKLAVGIKGLRSTLLCS